MRQRTLFRPRPSFPAPPSTPGGKRRVLPSEPKFSFVFNKTHKSDPSVPPLQKSLLTLIAICNIVITDCYMTLGEKLRYLREVEGALRGLDRELSQAELARLVQSEQGKGISQSYLSQIESGARPHLTNSTRMLLARFFKVHPGYLVDDPEGFQNELLSDLGAVEDKLDLYLVSGAERFARDAELHHALLTVAKHKDSRMCLILLGTILENQGLAERLIEVLKAPVAPAPKTKRR